MEKLVEGTIYLIGRPKYVSSRPLPAWTRGSVYTRGASWSVWDNTITRFLTKPTRKEITTAGQHRNSSIIAKMRISQKNVNTETASILAFCNDEVFLRAKVVLVWVWYPRLYRTYLFLTLTENFYQIYMFVHNKPVCLISVPSACNITASDKSMCNALTMWEPAAAAAMSKEMQHACKKTKTVSDPPRKKTPTWFVIGDVSCKANGNLTYCNNPNVLFFFF